jgi:hypothetical protein
MTTDVWRNFVSSMRYFDALYLITFSIYFFFVKLTLSSKPVLLNLSGAADPLQNYIIQCDKMERTKYMLVSGCQKTGQKQSIKIGNRSFESLNICKQQ